MLKLLLKKQLTEIFRSYFYDSKKNKARTRAGTIAYMILFAAIMVLFLGGIFTYLSLSICRPLADVGMGWLYFALMGLIALVLPSAACSTPTPACTCPGITIFCCRSPSP